MYKRLVLLLLEIILTTTDCSNQVAELSDTEVVPIYGVWSLDEIV